MRADETIRRSLGRGELVRFLYRLGRQSASGILKISARAPNLARASSPPPPPGRPEVFALRRGNAIVGDSELARKAVAARLARAVSEDSVMVAFEGGATAMIPPGAHHTLSLAGWARSHLEAQLDSALAESLVRQLAGVRMSVRTDLVPDPLDEADRRMLVAMTLPRRLDQIWPLARTPRFRLLAFIHFLRAVDALVVEGIVAERSAPIHRVDPQRAAALELLGIADDAEIDDIKRAYRRLARALHPDLQPNSDAERKRVLERRFAEVTAAYETLV